MLKIFLVRHGETNLNKKKVIQGQINTSLTYKGIQQAKAASRYLKKTDFDAAYSSDLKRAKDTCKIILRNRKTQMIVDKRLRERSTGMYEGKPGKYLRKAVKKSGKKFHEFKPKGGESLVDQLRRVNEFYKELLSKHKKGNILVVSHGGVMTVLLIDLEKDSHDNFRKYHPPNTAITILTVNNKGKSKIHTLNCTKHLE